MVFYDFEGSIPLDEICAHMMNGLVLDIFHIIYSRKKSFKKEIIDILIESDDRSDSTIGTYKNLVNIAVGKLEATRLIESFKSGKKEEYRLSNYGNIVADSFLFKLYEDLGEAFSKDIDFDDPILSGSIYFKNEIKSSVLNNQS